ncbi:lipoprotein [Spiroplasma endosymbiont of Cantharis lateralis]|uniref:lipoprotein n=1 Tax=Spiroplasma endosymbiont of Cantharis lateralis TaxID=3066277 RepID=UPI00313E8C34
MRKLLSLLGAVSLVATTSATVVACGNGETKPSPGIEYDKLVKDLNQDVNKIFVDHLQNNVYDKLIGLTIGEKENKFLNKTTIKTFKGKNADEIGQKNLDLLVEDINRILEVSQLETELNKLKLVNEYNILLNDVNTLYKGIVFDWNSLYINTNESKELYLANVLLDYKIEVQYKGEKEIELLTINDSFKYTLTNDATLKESSDNFYQNITKDYFSSQDSDAIKYSNLLWNDINVSKSESDGYGNIDEELDNYWNNTAQNNGFKESITKFIKTNYFSELSTLPLSFETDNFYKGSELSKTSLFNSINHTRSYDYKESIKFDYKTEKGQLMLESIFRKNPDINPTEFILRENYFTENNLKVWKKEYDRLKENFIKELNLNLNEEFKQTEEYKKSFSMNYVNLTGLSINFPDQEYIHYLPDFKIATNYIIDSNQNSKKMLDNMTEFSINSIKAFHAVYGVDYDYKYLDNNNSKDDILMALKKSEFTDAMDFNLVGVGGMENMNPVLSLDNNNLKSYRNDLLHLSNLPSSSLYLFDSRRTNYSGDVPNIIIRSKYWRVYDREKGIITKPYSETMNEPFVNEKLFYWNLGYLNMHFDLDQIIDGAKKEEKYFIVFS